MAEDLLKELLSDLKEIKDEIEQLKLMSNQLLEAHGFIQDKVRALENLMLNQSSDKESLQ